MLGAAARSAQYVHGGRDKVRRSLNQAIFKRIYVYSEENTQAKPRCWRGVC